MKRLNGDKKKIGQGGRFYFLTMITGEFVGCIDPIHRGEIRIFCIFVLIEKCGYVVISLQGEVSVRLTERSWQSRNLGIPWKMI